MAQMFLGVGNLHRGDDGVGPYLAQRLADNDILKERGVEVLPHSGEGASLMHLWEGLDFVVIVDCMKTGLPLGTVRRFDVLKEELHGGVFRYSSHLFGLAEAVEMARQLEKLPKAMIVYGVEGITFAFEEGRSPEVEAVLPEVEAAVIGEFCF
jgi:hydrogenase maturation protease